MHSPSPLDVGSSAYSSLCLVLFSPKRQVWTYIVGFLFEATFVLLLGRMYAMSGFQDAKRPRGPQETF